ncbi:MAG: TetR/AcrR family transcriptional regulator [Acidimicrobiales bacterium]
MVAPHPASEDGVDVVTDPSSATRAVGSPPVTKGERTRQRLLELAIDHFGRQGYRTTSVSEIARAAGLTQATAYAYFDSKESLFVAALDIDATTLVTEAHQALAGVPVREKLVAYLVQLYDGLEQRPLARRVLAGLEPEVLPHLIDLPAIRLATDLMISDIRASQKAGLVRDDIDAAVVGIGVEAMILGLLIGAVQSGGIFNPRYQGGVAAAFEAILKPPG